MDIGVRTFCEEMCRENGTAGLPGENSRKHCRHYRDTTDGKKLLMLWLTVRLNSLWAWTRCGYEIVEVGGVDVADGDDAEVGCGGGVEGEAGAGDGQRGEGGAGGSLREEDGDFVLVDGEEEKGGGLAVEVGEVGAFEGGVGWEAGGVGEVEAEGETALEPGFDGVAIGGDDLRGRCAGEGGEVLVE